MWSYQAADEPMLIVGYQSASGRSGSTRRHTPRYSSAASAPLIPLPAMWWWTIAAPASKQARASATISSSVIGTCGFWAFVVAPLMATSMITG